MATQYIKYAKKCEKKIYFLNYSFLVRGWLRSWAHLLVLEMAKFQLLKNSTNF